MTVSLADLLLPGVPVQRVEAALALAGGNEIGSGKFASPESSAALAVNGFGWFIEQPQALPPFACLSDLDWPAVRVDVERQMRFPWCGGRHPWLDAAVETEKHLIGVESNRFEPYRDAKAAKLLTAYDRDVWGEGMAPWCAMRDGLRTEPARFRHLDAAQLVKHAYGLVTEGRRLGKSPVLLYLYAEPTEGGVRFAACSWREWFCGFTGPTQVHAERVISRFAP